MSIQRILGISVGVVLSSTLLFGQDKGDAAKGKEVFEQCGVCHSADSDEKKMGPGLKGLFKKATLADGKTKTTDASVMEKVNKGGNGMPAYEEMLDKKEKDDLLAYLKTL